MGLTISDFFSYSIQGFIVENELYEGTHEDKNIARMLIEEYI
jgi:hypothetical protein